MPEVPPLFRESAQRRRPLVIAHRGSSAHAPENTLAAFRRAFADGAHLVETDLHVTADGAFVCIHDSTLERTTTGSGRVAERTLAEIKQFRAGGGKAGFDAERVPTLGELLAILPEDVGVALELKTDRFLDPEVGQRLADEIRAAGAVERVAFISFHLRRVLAMKSVAPEIFTGFITANRITPNVPTELAGPFWPILLLNPFYAWWARRRGMFVAPLDVNPRRRLWLYRLLRCDAVLANDPGDVLRALRTKKGR